MNGRLVALFLMIAAAKANANPAAEFFEKKVRPVLVEHCYSCHSAAAARDGTLKGGLQLDTRAGVRQGGDSGAVVVVGQPDKSLLIQAIRHEKDVAKMPPKGKLTDEQIDALAKWIADGAIDPRDGAIEADKYKDDMTEARQRWAFQLPRKHPVPPVVNPAWPKDDVDRFLLAKLEEKKLRPAAPADPSSLLRRIHADLAGLPPTPKEVEAFLEAANRDPRLAIEEVVDRLLASPRFGEKWARHWLDVARYAENDSGATNPSSWPWAFRYRDYVIAAFNADMPFDQFVREQIAGDELPAKNDAERARQLAASGFLVLGVSANKEEYVDEQMDVLTRAFWGQTIGCARCHDHKFDPLYMEDYAAMQGMFISSGFLPKAKLPTFDAERDAAFADHAKALQEARGKAMRGDEELERLFAARKLAYDPDASADEALAKLMIRDEGARKIAVAWLTQRDEQRAKVVALTAKSPPLPDYTHCASADKKARETFRELPDGKGGKKKVPVARAVPRVMVHDNAPTITKDQVGRLQLAQWAADPKHPLTARVFVNRVWQHLFGTGIVATPDNFGATGEAPTHPELLDTLAVQFMEDGWSTKRLIRRLMLTRAYQMASRFEDPSNAAVDPENRWRWRAERRRLPAEGIRDAMLAVSGRLNTNPLPGSLLTSPTGVRGNANYIMRLDHEHRSVYLPVVRDALHPALAAFDFATPQAVVGRRETSNIPTQALYLMNNPFVLRQASSLARQLLNEEMTEEARLARAYLTVYARRPSEGELKRDLAFLAAWPTSKDDAWRNLCQAYLCAAEFRYID
jgi:mono/diheme cytochrome c family protein